MVPEVQFLRSASAHYWAGEQGAESKRFRNQTDYFRNAHVDQFSAPVITGVGEQGQDLAIEHNEAQHRFCFVEKTELTTSQERGAGPGKTD
jgi:hypothetical protein